MLDSSTFPNVLARRTDWRLTTNSSFAYALLELPAIFDLYGGTSRARTRPHGFDSTDNVHALDNRPKHNVLPVQPRGLGGAQEELRPVRVGSG
jgi:hypothetical protein